MELWSGVIGAALSAVLAALVAVFVVWRTNKHQSRLASVALKFQREDAATALELQRALLEQQIHEQRQEARRAEKTKALSEFLAGVRDLGATNAETQIQSVGETQRRLQSAAAALDILGADDEGLHQLLQPSISTLYLLTVHRVMDFQLDQESGTAKHLWECVNTICELAPKWWNEAGGHDRKYIRSEIQSVTEAGADFLARNHPFSSSVRRDTV